MTWMTWRAISARPSGQGFNPVTDTLTATKTAGEHDAIDVSFVNDGTLTLSGPGRAVQVDPMLTPV
jgi:hypothetical protein